MTREDVIKNISSQLQGQYPWIVSTGLMSRELYGYGDHQANFYMVGSMGLASAIGLGVALNIKNTSKVFVLDGDASLLMGLNNLSNIALQQPVNFIHLVMDNNAYASCSEEKTASHKIKLDKVAAAVGYNNVFCVCKAEDLSKIINQALVLDGPTLILINIELGGKRDLPRPLDLPLVAKKFKQFLSE